MYLCHDHWDVDEDAAHLGLLGVGYGVYEGGIDLDRQASYSPSCTTLLLVVSDVHVYQGQMSNDRWGFQ